MTTPSWVVRAFVGRLVIILIILPQLPTIYKMYAIILFLHPAKLFYLEGDIRRSTKKHTIAGHRCNKGVSFGFVQRHKELWGDHDRVFLNRALPGAHNLTINH